MKRIIPVLIFLIAAAGLTAEPDQKTGPEPGNRMLQIRIEEGEHYLHRVPVFLFIAVKAPPQLALWLEDMDGNFIRTLFVTSRTALSDWRKAPGDKTPKEDLRRPESLPLWTHRSTGSTADRWDGPLPGVDAVSSATPKSGFSIQADLPEGVSRFRILAEVNASLDFNHSYPEEAEKGSSGYSGGPWGSGQPALVYAAEVDRSETGAGPLELELQGHSSPDGSTGELYTDMDGITTAREIIGKIEAELR